MARLIALLIGLALLGYVAAQADLAEVWSAMLRLGWVGAAAVAAIYFAAFVVDSASWQLMLPSARLDAGWLTRLTKIRLVGEAFNTIVPAGSLGGEPVKAYLLKRQHGLGYRESGASLIIAKTVNLLALVAFSAVGLVLMWRAAGVSEAFRLSAAAGLGALALGVVGFYAVQRWRAASRLAGTLARFRIGRPLGRFLAHIQDVDDRFTAFYAARRGRFAAAFGLAFGNWLINAAEVYAILWFLDRPITWAEAWLIETAAQLVRAGAFLIPGSLGATEAVMVLVFEALMGRPGLGLAVALIRRGREALWIAAGLLLGWRYSFTPAAVPLALRAGGEADTGER
jgi:uncharacterized protein (TIRG00374 family)